MPLPLKGNGEDNTNIIQKKQEKGERQKHFFYLVIINKYPSYKGYLGNGNFV
jgi:hypothetical protein